MRLRRTILGGACLLLTAILTAPADGQQPKKDQAKRIDPAKLLEQNDKNKDGFIDRDEAPDNLKNRFDQIDANKDGKLSKAELEKMAQAKGGRPGEVITPAAKGERITTDKLKVGDLAPDFTLPLLSNKGNMTLSSFKEKKPVVLIFASYT